MKQMLKVVFVGATLAAAVAVASAQQQTQRIVGTIANIQGRTLGIKTKQGEIKVHLTDNAAVFGIERKTLADIKPGLFLGVGAIPQSDGSQKAVRINIFPPGQRPNPGFRPWAGAPQGTMTNATVDTAVASVDGQVLMLKYQDGEKKVVVTPQAQIVGTVAGDKSEFKLGVAIVIVRATTLPDGSFEADRINVGRDGVVPQ